MKLSLTKDTLTELTNDELGGIAGGASQTEQCVSGIIQCTIDRVKNTTTLRAC